MVGSRKMNAWTVYTVLGDVITVKEEELFAGQSFHIDE